MAGTPAVPDMRLELVPLPVSDVDRAKAFYDQAGFGNLHDTQVTETMRVVQLTPPGSSCAIVFGTGMGPITDMVPACRLTCGVPLEAWTLWFELILFVCPLR